MYLIKPRIMIAIVIIATCLLINSVSSHAALTSKGVDLILNQESQTAQQPTGFVGFRLGDGPEPGTIAVIGVGKDGPAEKAASWREMF